MELKWLRDAVALADCGSFSAAAEMRCITQSAFSRRIQAVEAWFGTALFDRTTSPISLTPGGKEFLPRARRMIADTQSLKQDVREIGTRSDELIRLVTSHRLSVTTAPKLIAQFLALRPNCRVYVEPTLQDRDLEDDRPNSLIGDRADFLLSYEYDDPDLGPFSSEGLERCLVSKERILAVASPAYRQQIGDTWRRRASKPINYLGYPPASFTESVVAPLLDGLGAQVQKVYESSASESIRAAAIEGIGIAWLAERTIADDLAAGRLVQLDGEHLMGKIGIALFRRVAPVCERSDEFWNITRTLHELQFNQANTSL